MYELVLASPSAHADQREKAIEWVAAASRRPAGLLALAGWSCAVALRRYERPLFNAYVLPIPGGHVCVSFVVDSDPVASSDAIRQPLERHLA